jgi:hypothetical protein
MSSPCMDRRVGSGYWNSVLATALTCIVTDYGVQTLKEVSTAFVGLVPMRMSETSQTTELPAGSRDTCTCDPSSASISRLSLLWMDELTPEHQTHQSALILLEMVALAFCLSPPGPDWRRVSSWPTRSEACQEGMKISLRHSWVMSGSFRLSFFPLVLTAKLSPSAKGS